MIQNISKLCSLVVLLLWCTEVSGFTPTNIYHLVSNPQQQQQQQQIQHIHRHETFLLAKKAGGKKKAGKKNKRNSSSGSSPAVKTTEAFGGSSKQATKKAPAEAPEKPPVVEKPAEDQPKKTIEAKKAPIKKQQEEEDVATKKAREKYQRQLLAMRIQMDQKAADSKAIEALETEETMDDHFARIAAEKKAARLAIEQQLKQEETETKSKEQIQAELDRLAGMAKESFGHLKAENKAQQQQEVKDNNIAQTKITNEEMQPNDAEQFGAPLAPEEVAQQQQQQQQEAPPPAQPILPDQLRGTFGEPINLAGNPMAKSNTNPQEHFMQQRQSRTRTPRYGPDNLISWGQTRPHDQPRLAGPEEQIRMQEKRFAEQAKQKLEAQVAAKQLAKAKEQQEAQMLAEQQQQEEEDKAMASAAAASAKTNANVQQQQQQQQQQSMLLPDQLRGVGGEEINLGGQPVSQGSRVGSRNPQSNQRLSQPPPSYGPDAPINWGQQRSHDQAPLLDLEEQLRQQKAQQAEHAKRALEDQIASAQAKIKEEASDTSSSTEPKHQEPKNVPVTQNIAPNEPGSSLNRDMFSERPRLSQKKPRYSPDNSIIRGQQRPNEQPMILGPEERIRQAQEQQAQESRRALEAKIASEQMNKQAEGAAAAPTLPDAEETILSEHKRMSNEEHERLERRKQAQEAGRALERERLANVERANQRNKISNYGPDPGIVWSKQRPHEQTPLLGFEQKTRIEEERLMKQKKRDLEAKVAEEQARKAKNGEYDEPIPTNPQKSIRSQLGYGGPDPSDSIWGRTRGPDQTRLLDPEEEMRHALKQAERTDFMQGDPSSLADQTAEQKKQLYEKMHVQQQKATRHKPDPNIMWDRQRIDEQVPPLDYEEQLRLAKEQEEEGEQGV